MLADAGRPAAALDALDALPPERVTLYQPLKALRLLMARGEADPLPRLSRIIPTAPSARLG